MGIHIRGIGAALPNQVLTNQALVEKYPGLRTTAEWIEQRVGIQERRIAPEHMTLDDLAEQAAQDCLEKSHLKPEDIDLIVLSSSSDEQAQPPAACRLQDRLGIGHKFVPAFDVKSVCAGGVVALSTAQDRMLASQSNPKLYGQPFNRALVVATEIYSRILNWANRATCILFGDGAGAVVLEQVGSPHPKADHYIQFEMGSDGRGHKVIEVPPGGKFQMEGPKVRDFANDTAPATIEKLLHRNGLKPQDVKLVIFHQANLRMIETMMEKLGLPMEKTHTTVEKYGNTASASIFITLADAVAAGKLQPGDKVVTVGFGGGLSWGAALFEA